jgi:uncharacterized membrane protein
MTRGRLEAFSDGVIAIIITIMVLELRPPDGVSWEAIRPLAPKLCGYVLSFVFVAIYWNNHHHLMHAVQRINGKVLWANMHLLFWLSLVPAVTAWMGDQRAAPVTVAAYGVVLLLSGVAYFILTRALLAIHAPDSHLAVALGRDWKGKVSVIAYAAAVAAAYANRWVAIVIYVAVAILWLVPDSRIERTLEGSSGG